MGEAISLALREPASKVRFGQLGALLAELTPENLSGAVEAFEANQALLGEAELRMVASAWARLDAPGAFERVRDAWPQRFPRRIVLSEIVYDWALREPPAAVEAVGSLPEGDAALTEEVARKLIEGWAQTPDFRSATDYVAGLPQGALQQGLTTLIAQQRFKLEGPAALIAWAESVREDAPRKFRLVAFRKAARTLAQVDPQAAATWIEKQHGKDYSKGTTRIVATQWVEADPEAAFAWLLSRPDDDERKHAVGFAFRDWLRREPQAAEAWLVGTPPGAVLDPAIDAYARSVVSKSPVKAVEWAERIEDVDLRAEVLTAIGQKWFAQDPAATGAWLARAGLSVEIAEAIQHPRPQRRAHRRPQVER